MAKALGQESCPYELYSQLDLGVKQYERSVKLGYEDIEGFIKQEYSRLLDCEQAYIGWEN